jgi:hypothetical protein
MRHDMLWLFGFVVACGSADEAARERGNTSNDPPSSGAEAPPGTSTASPLGSLSPRSPTPSPPARLPPGTGIKWHPGHYVAGGGQQTPNRVTGSRAQWQSALSSDSHLKGVRAVYYWFDLEDKRGVYTTQVIDDDIAFLRMLNPSYKIIIEVWSRDFGHATALPSTPQTSGSVPDYIIESGGAALNSNGVLAAFWRPPVNDRLIALQQYLGARYDGNANVEAIHTDEFAPAPPKSDPTYSAAATWTEMQRLMTAMVKAWPHTNKFFLGNWPGIGGSGQTGAPTTLAFAQSIGFGVGGPDIMPNKSTWPNGSETWGEQALQGINGFGTTDFRGTLPISYQNENPYQWAGLTPAMCETYAYDYLKASHITWIIATATTGQGLMPWSATLAALTGQTFRIHADCPANYKGACDPS